jgi:hypothetical protein
MEQGSSGEPCFEKLDGNFGSGVQIVELAFVEMLKAGERFYNNGFIYLAN